MTHLPELSQLERLRTDRTAISDFAVLGFANPSDIDAHDNDTSDITAGISSRGLGNSGSGGGNYIKLEENFLT